MKLLLLTPAAFGGHGGIAQFNRDLITALSRLAHIDAIDVLPRAADPERRPALPPGTWQSTRAARGRWGYLRAVAARRRHAPEYARVLCGHINLLPLARWVARGRPIDLFIHGIDAWQRPRGALRPRRLDGVARVISVSRFTLDRFLDWSGLAGDHGHVLPNCVDLKRFHPDSGTIARAGPRPVIATLARLAASERLKGIDEMFAALPRIIEVHPQAQFRVGGDGDDRPRLMAAATRLGLADHVEFTGYVAEDAKVDFYRDADCFVLPSRGEGFGIVLLEALACGLPVVASSRDGSGEAIRAGAWGRIADPLAPHALADAVLDALREPPGTPPPDIVDAGFDAYARRVADLYPGSVAS